MRWKESRAIPTSSGRILVQTGPTWSNKMSAVDEPGQTIPVPAAGESILLEIDGELYQINVGDATDQVQDALINAVQR